MGSQVTFQHVSPPEFNVLWKTGWQCLTMLQLPQTQLFQPSFLHQRTEIPEHTRPPILLRSATTADTTTCGSPSVSAVGSTPHTPVPRSKTSWQEAPEHFLCCAVFLWVWFFLLCVCVFFVCFFTKNLTLEFLPSDQLCGLFDQLTDFLLRQKYYESPKLLRHV